MIKKEEIGEDIYNNKTKDGMNNGRNKEIC